jgi:arylformamidase
VKKALAVFFTLIFFFASPAFAEVFSDVSYGDLPQQKLDIYKPDVESEGGSPVIVYIHGGAWRMGSKSIGKKHGSFYSAKGIILVSIDYRLLPDARHPDQVKDCAAAAAWVAKHIGEYGGDPSKMYLAGHSAGAHLAALLTTTDKYLSQYGLSATLFKAVFPLDTASFDFSIPPDGKLERFMKRTIADVFGTSKEALEEASPTYLAYHDTALKPPFILFVTSNRPDAVAQTQAFEIALKNVGTPVKTFVIEGKTHMEMNAGMSEPDSPISREILKSMRIN